MKYLIKIQNSTFSISHSLANALIDTKYSCSPVVQNRTKVFILDDSHISLFQVISTTSLTHFYAFFSGNKYRVAKKFFIFLGSNSKNLNKSVIRSRRNINLDKFYTKSSVAELCVSAFIANITIREQDLIVEPSAGNGSFIQPLKRIKCEKIFIDIAPDNNQIGSLNFLDWTPPSVSGKIHVVGNPPFGRQSSMCHKFLDTRRTSRIA